MNFTPKSTPPVSNTKRSPWKYYYLILLGIVFVVTSVFVVDNTPSETALRSIAQRESEGVDSEYPDDQEIVVVTLKYDEYHKPDCPWIDGRTRRMTKYKARMSGFKPCPYCLEYDD